MKRSLEYSKPQGRTCALLLTILCLSLSSTLAGDEQWDERFGSLPTNYYYGSLVHYRGEVYGSNRKWDGTNLVEWVGTSPRLAKAVNGTDLFVGGDYSATSGLPSSGVARWDGTNWHGVPTGVGVNDFGYFVAALATSGADLYVGGHFLLPGPAIAKGIVRSDGTNWYDLTAGLTDPEDPDIGPFVYALAVKDGTVYACGQIAVSAGVQAGVVKWNGTNWTVLGSGITGAVTMAFKGDELFVAGAGLSKWDGTKWSSVGRTDGAIYALAIHGDDVYIGGDFGSVGGVVTANIAKWDGTNWSALGGGVTGAFSRVYGIAVWGNDVIVSGTFISAGGKPSIHFAIWHEMPSLNASYASGMLQLSWPSTFTNCVLEACETLSGGSWTDASPPPTTNQYSVNPSGPSKFFRLKRRP